MNIDFTVSPLYNISSEEVLMQLLQIQNPKYLNQAFIINRFHPSISAKNRLIEPTFDPEFKKIQNLLFECLSIIPFPSNVFCVNKGKSSIDNAKLYQNVRYIYKTDISSFFQNTHREKIFQFFRTKLQLPSNIASILTNFTTIDLDLFFNNYAKNHSKPYKYETEIKNFIKKKNIKAKNHLIFGASTSTILSFLASLDMFNEISELCKLNNISFSIYVDDITFSSEEPISKAFRIKISQIISKYKYKNNIKKSQYYNQNKSIKITGVIINTKKECVIPSSITLSITQLRKQFKLASTKEEKIEIRNKLIGLILYARQIKPNVYPNLLNYIKNVEI